MSKVETQVDDPKKLALRCKTLELQLRQSVSKKEHHEITSKLEKQIDSLERDLDRARTDNQKTIAINKQIAGVEGLIESLIKTANAQGKALDFIEEEASTRGKVQTAQGKVLDKLATGTVPSSVYLQALNKVRDLEEDKRGMVRRFDYNSLETRFQELSRQLSTMVPASEYASLKERFDEATKQMADMVPSSDYAALKLKVEELEGAIYTMVPREQFVSSEMRVKELEARLAEHVPQSVYDELVSRVVSLAEAVTGGAVQPEEAKAEPQSEAVPQTGAEPQVEVIEASPEPLVEVPAEPQPEAVEAVAAELTAQTSAEPQPEVEAVAQEPPAQIAAEAIAAEAVAPEATAQVVETVPDAQPEIIAAEPQVEIATEAVETIVVAEQSIPEVAEPIATMDAPAAPVAQENSAPEIREVASQLAEIKSQSQEAQGADAAIGDALAEEPQAQAEPTVVKDAAEPATQPAAPAITISVSDDSETTQ
jgi:hypothetical protein